MLGESIDFNYNNTSLLIGCYGSNKIKELNMYNHTIYDVPWESDGEFSLKISGNIFSLSQASNAKYYCVGCSRLNQIRIYSTLNSSDQENESNIYELICHTSILQNPIFSCNFSASGKYLAYSSAKEGFSLIKMYKTN